jgi:hypothetical protein
MALFFQQAQVERLTGFAEIDGSMGEGDLDAFFVEGQFQPS